jgi:hypothetical protein
MKHLFHKKDIDEFYENPWDILEMSHEDKSVWCEGTITPEDIEIAYINSEVVSYIENGEEHHDIEEEIKIKDWKKKNRYIARASCVNENYNPNSVFTKCDIEGLKSDCIPVWVIRLK